MQYDSGRPGLLHLLDLVEVLGERRSRGDERSAQRHSQICGSEIHNYCRAARIVVTISRSAVLCDSLLSGEMMRVVVATTFKIRCASDPRFEHRGFPTDLDFRNQAALAELY